MIILIIKVIIIKIMVIIIAIMVTMVIKIVINSINFINQPIIIKMDFITLIMVKLKVKI